MPNYVLATGFEHGDTSLYTITGIGVGIGTPAHTGARALSIAENYGFSSATIPFAGGATFNEVWGSFWLDAPSSSSQLVGYALGDGGTLVIAINGSGNIALLRNGTTILDTTIAFPINRYFQVFTHLKVNGTTGVFEIRVDGGSLQTFTGNTQPGASNQIVGVYGRSGVGGSSIKLDDIVCASDTWPEDMRFVALTPNGNSSVSWVASTGGANYTTVDEIPASDTDYNYSTVNGQQDLYTLTDFDNTGNGGKTPLVVHQVVRAKCETGAGGGIKMILASGATQDASAAITLNTAFKSYDRLCLLDPSGAAWTDAVLDGLTAGVESVL